MAKMPGSLASIFAADRRMNIDQSRRRAAEARARSKASKQKGSDVGKFVGGAVGLLSMLHPATRPFAKTIIPAAAKIGGMVGGGDVSLGNIADVGVDLATGYTGAEMKKKDALLNFLKYGNYGNQSFAASPKEDKEATAGEFERALIRGRYGQN